MKALRISKDLSLPLDTVTSTLVIYGGKGMGKTNCGSVLVEELSRCGLRWAWLDPLGVSWGLRHDAAGTGRGVECLILGGPHGDIPIEPSGGAAVADVVADEAVNVLIDFSRHANGEMWGRSERIRFCTDYALRLFQRQGQLVGSHRREPLFQVLDEAARYVPQIIPAGSPDIAKCVSAWEQITEEGRNIGLGVGLLTQRSARMNKSVSELADAMIAFRTVGPNSLEAIMDWLGTHIEKARIKTLSEQVRMLDRGSALVVSPGWLKFEGVVHMRLRETFDSSATPKPGERARTARGEGAKPDLDKIRERMATTIERAKADDPKELRRQLAELKRELGQAQKARPTAKPGVTEDKAVLRQQAAIIRSLKRALEAAMKFVVTVSAQGFDVPGVDKAELEKAIHAAVGRAIALVDDRLAARGKAIERLREQAAQLAKAIKAAVDDPDVELSIDVVKNEPFTVAPGHVRRPARRVEGPVSQRILNALAELEQLGAREPGRELVAFLAGYSNLTSKGFVNAISELRTGDLVSYPDSGTVALTPDGRAKAQPPERARSSAEIQTRVISMLGGASGRILAPLIKAYPRALARDQVAASAGYTNLTSKGFVNAVSRLRTLGFVDYPDRGSVVATPVLFLEGR